MYDMPEWLRLTIRCSLLEARYHALMQAEKQRPAQPWDQGRFMRRRKREERIYALARAVRGRATLAAHGAGVIGEDWRRVYFPLAFSNPVFTRTKAKYAAVDLGALRRDWRSELARIAQFGPQQIDNDPRPMAWRKEGAQA